MIERDLAVDTGREHVVDVTDACEDFCREKGDGLLNVFAPHATCGVALLETGSGSEDDLAETLGRLLPRDERWSHRHGSRGHGADHVLPALVSPSLVVPVRGGRMRLGTWQRVVVVDLNEDNPRRTLRLSFLAG